MATIKTKNAEETSKVTSKVASKVSGDLEEAANNAIIALEEAAQEYTEKGSKCQEELDAFKAGANWQEQKDKSKVLTEEQCRKLSDDAFELGKDAMKQQLMAKAVDAVLSSTITGSEQVVSANVGYGELGKNGDKVKIIILRRNNYE